MAYLVKSFLELSGFHKWVFKYNFSQLLLFYADLQYFHFYCRKILELSAIVNTKILLVVSSRARKIIQQKITNKNIKWLKWNLKNKVCKIEFMKTNWIFHFSFIFLLMFHSRHILITGKNFIICFLPLTVFQLFWKFWYRAKC